MKWLGDGALDRLATSLQTPDLSGTRYRALRFLASGGMAAIWLAEDTVLQRKVALKILDLDDGRSELATRLAREAHILAALEHPGIVPVHDAGTLPDGAVFYCMKYVEGERLDEFVTKVPALADRLRLLLRIAEPIAFAHSRGIIHRDLKPENVMVGRFGEVLVMDWGLGKLLNNSEVSTGQGQAANQQAERTVTNVPGTGHGTILGTPGYMAPEQARGDVARMDERTDVYGLGAILAFLLRSDGTGSVAFKRAPRRIQAVCAKAMHSDPAHRYASVEELAADITHYLSDLPVRAYPESVFERAGRLLKRHQTAVILVAAYLLMRLLFILFSRH